MDLTEHISKEEVKSVLCEKYCLEVLEIKLLPGYEDSNIKVTSMQVGGEECFHVLKVSAASTELCTLDLQNAMMLHLEKLGIPTCTPVETTDGGFVTRLPPTSDQNTELRARLLTYIDGITFEESDKSLSLLQKVGVFVGKTCKALKTFRFDSYKPTQSLFEFSKILKVEALAEKYLSRKDSGMSGQIFYQYRTMVYPLLCELQTGFVHGDMNGRNIIIKEVWDNDSSKALLEVAGLIDFGDAYKGVYVFEIATVMADLLATCFDFLDPKEVGNSLLAGIIQEFTLSELELRVLKICVCIRLVQIYVLIEDIITRKKQYNLDVNVSYFEKCRRNFMDVCKYLWFNSDTNFKTLMQRSAKFK